MFGANYYEVRQGQYYQSESFYGSGGGASVSVYQLLNPGMLIPVSVVARGGMRDSTYMDTSQTAGNFALPANQITSFTRGGIRLAGKEPVLYPDLVWNCPSGLNGNGAWTASNMVSPMTGASAPT